MASTLFQRYIIPVILDKIASYLDSNSSINLKHICHLNNKLRPLLSHRLDVSDIPLRD